MKKVLSMLFIILSVVVIAGCNNSTEIKAIEQGKLSLANLEYEKALGSFELAINEGTKDEEVIKLVSIITGFNDSKNLIEEDEFEKAKKILDGINKDYKNYTIKAAIDHLKEEISHFENNNVAIEEKLESVDQLLSEGKYADSKVITDEIINSEGLISITQKEKMDNQVKIIEGELARIESERINKEKEELETKKKVELEAKKKEETLKKKTSLSVEEAKKIVLNGSTTHAARHDASADVIVDGVTYYLLDVYSINGGSAANAMFVSSKDGSIHDTSKFSHLW